MLVRNLLRLGRPAPAQGQLQRVLETGPDPEASWLLSRAHLQQGTISTATEVLGQARSYRGEHTLESEPGPDAREARCARCHQEIDETWRAGAVTRSRSIGARSSKNYFCQTIPCQTRATPASLTR